MDTVLLSVSKVSLYLYLITKNVAKINKIIIDLILTCVLKHSYISGANPGELLANPPPPPPSLTGLVYCNDCGTHN